MKRQLKNQPKNNAIDLIVIGLGNPGRRYEKTRHNAGFLAVDILAERLSVSLKKRPFRPVETAEGGYNGKSIVLVKPLTFMNRSGDIIPWTFKRYLPDREKIIVIADHLDIPCGTLRLKRSGSSGGQKGLQSIINALGHSDFSRMYIGVGRPTDGVSVVDHVLGIPENGENDMFLDAIGKAADGILRLLEEPIEKVMNDVNRRTNS